MRRRPDAGELKQLRGAKHATRQNDTAPRADHLGLSVLQIGDTPSAAIFEQYTFGGNTGQDVEIGIARLVAQERPRGSPALAALLRDLVQADAFLPRAVEIVVTRDLQARPRLDEIHAAGIGEALLAHPQRPVGAVKIIGPAHIMLGAFEPRQHIVIRPAGAAHCRPIVVIPFVAADIDHRVDRARSAQPLAARLVPAAAIQPRLRHGFVIPIGLVGLKREERRDACAQASVATPSFEQGDGEFSPVAQASGSGCPAGSTPDDNDIGFFHSVSPDPPAVAGRYIFVARQRALIVSDVSRLPSWLHPGGITI